MSITRLPVHASSLREKLTQPALTSAGALYETAGEHGLRCLACAHACVVASGSAGACGVRWNRGGVMQVPFGYVARRYVRAVETNTIFHVLPGAKALTFGMYGCDLRCPYCHNHRVSQALRDGDGAEQPTATTAEALVDEAVMAGCRVVCAAYNEPMISAEWAQAVFRTAKQRGLRTAVVSDGHSTPQALRFLRDDVDVFRVDLKAGSETQYKKLGGRLQPVLESIATAKALGYWVEVVTLVVPGINHDHRTLAQIGGQLREIDAAIPWHLNAFVPRYRMSESAPSNPLLLMMAAGAAYVAGSRFVYVGNTASCAELAHTRCPECHAVLIRRHDYETTQLGFDGASCPGCASPIPGIWA
jgi:pyruvate formate lyase activating enzyme